jgi:catechol 2,3-dioxygenase-like lactoylglutathione lyase family enzyme
MEGPQRQGKALGALSMPYSPTETFLFFLKETRMYCKKLCTTASLFMFLILGHVPGQTPASVQAPAAARAPLGAVLAPSPASADNPLQLTVDHGTLSVADIDKEVAWYVDVLGFKEVGGGKMGDNFDHRELRIPGVFRIDLSWQKGSARHIGPASDMEQGWRHIVFKTPNLDQALELLQAKNVAVKVNRNKKTNAITEMFIQDPEGNEIELQ